MIFMTTGKSARKKLKVHKTSSELKRRFSEISNKNDAVAAEWLK